MLRIKPVTETSASEEIQLTYAEIKKSLGVSAVPLYFQYSGNYPEFHEYLWSVLAPNFEIPRFFQSFGNRNGRII